MTMISVCLCRCRWLNGGCDGRLLIWWWLHQPSPAPFSFLLLLSDFDLDVDDDDDCDGKLQRTNIILSRTINRVHTLPRFPPPRPFSPTRRFTGVRRSVVFEHRFYHYQSPRTYYHAPSCRFTTIHFLLLILFPFQHDQRHNSC